ncbi:MAG TPA: metallophosphoesterase [Rhizomicrobium sp.]|nr:metallophosphoesterase [Rhizomicrobium sp.]
MKKLALAVFLFFPSIAQSADSAWVQAVAGGYEARVVTGAASCPVLHTDHGDAQMAVRAAADANFALTCGAMVPEGTKTAAIGATVLPVPVSHPQRILVLGDTGCRIKGATLQAWTDPAQWPFPQLAAAAASLKPDLVIHVGDYLYRESACPQGNQGCAGSPWGDNWTTWQADFFTPAVPLLAAAPIVLARGNHEDCKRAGPGWERLQGPAAFNGACNVHEPLYTVDLGGLTLAVLDDAVSDETDLDRDTAKVYADEIESVAKLPAPVWFVHHRPTWAAISGPLGIPVGGNLTLIEASQIEQAKRLPPMPHSVELMLSGHIHTFESINFEQDVPPQIVAGNGGDNLDVTPRNLRGSQFLGHSGVRVADGLSVGGFGFLLMTRVADGWMIDLYDPAAKPKGECHFTSPQGSKRGRLDCPGLKT